MRITWKSQQHRQRQRPIKILPLFRGLLVLLPCTVLYYYYNVTTTTTLSWWSSTRISTKNVIQHGYHDSPIQPATTTTTKATPPPLVTFIIPSTLHRSTLSRTLQSLLHQTNPHWEAIIGIDTVMMQQQQQSIRDHNIHVINYDDDTRIRYVNVTTAGTDRGPNANGAGDIRNHIMKSNMMMVQQQQPQQTTTTSSHTDARWMAFVDDDDTVSPYYVEYLAQLSHQSPQAPKQPDVVLFRMRDVRPAKQFWYRGILPPLAHGPVASVAAVGISFAIRRQFWMDNTRLRFRPGMAEDFDFLYQAQHVYGATVSMSCCVAYYVRSAPPPPPTRGTVVPQDDCTASFWQPALVLPHDLRKIRTLHDILNLPTTRQFLANHTTLATTATAIHNFRPCREERQTKHASWWWKPFA
eukprot:scaffold18819_cov268-Amphora_coffeaeformis.AAC.9